MGGRRKIFLFDDEMNTISKVYIGLLLKNFSVEATTDPEEIDQRMKRFQPDIAIVNNDVPGFDGHEICLLLKKQLNKPIILLSEKHSAKPAQIDHCSADEIIMKPINIKEMHEVIERLLATYQ